MLTHYRRVLALPGALAFSSSGLLARLPISMVSLGIVLLVSTRTGSYGLAGAVAASYLIAHAAFAVPQGRMADRLGQHRLLPVTILVFTAALVGMMTAVEAGWPTPVPHAFAAVAGMALPQIGSCIRARWAYVVTAPRQLQTAFSLEAVVDETVFMLGPTLVTVLATVVHPLAGLSAAALSALVGTLLLSAQRRTEPPVEARPVTTDGERGTRARVARPPMPWGVLGPLVLSSAGLGMLFGASEVAAVAFSEERGRTALAGVLLAVFALGSLTSGLVSGMVTWRSSHARRFRVGTAGLAVAMFPLPFIDSFWLLGAVLLVAGLAISPTLIASVSWAEETVPAGRLTEGISILITGISVGVAPGAAVAGLVVDRWGGSPSFWVTFGAGAFAAVVAGVAALLPLPSPAARPETPDRREEIEAGRVDPGMPGAVDPSEHDC